MKSSLYPGASDASVDMVLAYCTATGLDPMTKPVHIVPMSVATGEKDRNGYDVKAMRDVVMPRHRAVSHQCDAHRTVRRLQ